MSVETLDRPAAAFEIDPATQEIFRLATLPSVLPERGRGPVHTRTVRRWTNQGFTLKDGSRVKLPTIRLGKEAFTSRQALAWFMAQLTRGLGSPDPAA